MASWQDYLIEAFGGLHGYIGGQISGMYDEQESTRLGMTELERTIYNTWSAVALVPAAHLQRQYCCHPRCGRPFQLCRERSNESVAVDGTLSGVLLTGCNAMILVAASVGESKTHLQYYEKLGWTSETRRQDSAECGAIGNDDCADIATARIKAAQRPEETERQTKMRLNKEWHACMTEKSYRDTRAVPQ